MTRKNFPRLALIFAAPQLIFAVAVNADMVTRDYVYRASFDVTSLTTIDFDLYNGDTYFDDAYVLIYNLSINDTPWSGALPFNSTPLGDPRVNIEGSILRLSEGPTTGSWALDTTSATADFSAQPLTGRLKFDVHFFGRIGSTEDESYNVLWARLNGSDVLQLDDTSGPAVVPAPGAALLAAVGLACVGLVRRLRGQQS